MSSKPTPQQLESFVAHTMTNLPDSLRLRKATLVTLLYLLPRDFAGRCEVVKSLEAIHAHERTQLKFSALLSK